MTYEAYTCRHFSWKQYLPITIWDFSSHIIFSLSKYCCCLFISWGVSRKVTDDFVVCCRVHSSDSTHIDPLAEGQCVISHHLRHLTQGSCCISCKYWLVSDWLILVWFWGIHHWGYCHIFFCFLWHVYGQNVSYKSRE